MTSNDRPSRGFTGAEGPRPAPGEDTLKTKKIQVERKAFLFALKENPRGRFLRITEDVGGRHETIIIPSTGLEEFTHVLAEMAQASAETPLKTHQP